jgi:hypothetical protein
MRFFQAISESSNISRNINITEWTMHGKSLIQYQGYSPGAINVTNIGPFKNIFCINI